MNKHAVQLDELTNSLVGLSVFALAVHKCLKMVQLNQTVKMVRFPV